MNTVTIENNLLPLDYHANRINDCRNNIKTVQT